MVKALFRVFDYSGRSSRWEYWSFLIGFSLVLVLVGAWASGYQQSHDGLMPRLGDDDAALLGLATLALLVAPNLALRVRRYHDFGWSGWAVLWTFVPLVNIVMELMLLFRGPVAPPAAYVVEPSPHVTVYATPPVRVDDHGRAQVGHVEQIARLADLHAQGALTAQEFAAAKAKVLRS